MAGDRRRDSVEIPSSKECCAVSKLLGRIAAGSRAPPYIAEQIDVALAGKIEAMAIAADERARRGGQLQPATRAAQQPVAGTACERHHDAAPPTRRVRSVSSSTDPTGCDERQ
jgi:hypothetical protein